MCLLFPLQGCLPLVLMFDVKEEIDMDQGTFISIGKFVIISKLSGTVFVHKN